jgi:type IX secretion system PorP/SprF family membrane protein
MNKIVYSCFIFLFIIAVKPVFGQQDPLITQYMFNTLMYNPAFAGVEGLTKATIMHRTQWAGYEPSFGQGGPQNTMMVNLNAPVLRMRSGVGVHIVNDNLGPINNLEAQISGAYHLGIRNSKLSIGARAGFYSQTFDPDKYRWAQEDDPLRMAGKETQVLPDVAVGAFFRAEKFYAGLSFTHITRAKFDWAHDRTRNSLETHMYVTGGYDYEFSHSLTFTPSVLIRSEFNTYSFDLSCVATYNEKMWGGLSFRQSEAIMMLLGYSLLKDNSLRMGYAFDFVIKGADAKARTSHEFMLSYVLPAASAGGKKVVRTPRFRH